MSICHYEMLFKKNTKVTDGQIIARVRESGFILVSKDERMERDWIEDIVKYKARVILLTDSQGNATQFGAALICAEKKYERILLDNPEGPLVIKINSSGDVVKIRGEQELFARRDKLLTSRIVRSKRLGVASVGVAQAKQQASP